MFQTADCSRNSAFSSIAGDGQHIWTAVSLPLNRPWFFVTCNKMTDQGLVTHSIMISSIAQIQELAGLHSDSFKLGDVHLMSPGWVNRTDTWKMDRLQAVWEGLHPLNGLRVQVFTLTDGRRYLDTSKDIEPSSLENLICTAAF